jgi:hypothetical protein
MTETALYYLFSTIAQAYGAIVGIIGVFAVYRLQQESRKREAIREGLLESRYRGLKDLSEEATGWGSEDIILHFHEPQDPQEKHFLESLKESPGDYNYVRYEVEKLQGSVELGTRIRQRLMSFMKLHLPLIVISILLIHLVPLALTPFKNRTSPEIFCIVLLPLCLVLYLSFKMMWTLVKTLLDE